MKRASILFCVSLCTGDEHIFETIGDCRFRISASSFFQLNTDAAEKLYSVVRDCAHPDRNAYLLDVGCGTGTIATFLAPGFRHVYGVDLEVLAIGDAVYNADANKRDNCTFYCDLAERTLPRLLKDFYYEAVTAVVNPSRGGVHWKIVQALRESPAVERVIYVSCKPFGNAMHNMVELCMPSSADLKGESFYPIEVVPVDMFPHTEHCELVVTFIRNRVHFH